MAKIAISGKQNRDFWGEERSRARRSTAETVDQLQREDKRLDAWLTKLEADVNFRFPDLEQRAWHKIDTDSISYIIFRGAPRKVMDVRTQ